MGEVNSRGPTVLSKSIGLRSRSSSRTFGLRSPARPPALPAEGVRGVVRTGSSAVSVLQRRLPSCGAALESLAGGVEVSGE